MPRFVELAEESEDLKEWQKNAIASAIVVAAAVVGLAALFALVSLGGCSLGGRDEEDPHLPAPSKEALDRLRGNSVPVYWLGHSFHSLKLTGVSSEDGERTVVYGTPNCYSDPGSGSGCDYPVTISNDIGRPSPFVPPAGRRRLCVEHAGPAVLLINCRHPNQARLYSGGTATYLRVRPRSPLKIDQVASQLIAINATRVAKFGLIPSLENQLPAPEPISCPAIRFLVPWWVATVRREFGRNPQCPGN
jgi:hypothetical protein